MSWGRLALPGLVLVVVLTRTVHVEPARAPASITEALGLLGTAGESSARASGSRELQRHFEKRYDHWQDARAKRPAAVAGVATRPPPALAGVVAVLSVMGLHEVAALWLYLLADDADDANDSVLQELCLQATSLLDPHFVEASLILAYIRRPTDPAEAEQILKSALRWNSEDWEVWYDLAWLYLRGASCAAIPSKSARASGQPVWAVGHWPNRPRDLQKAREYLQGAMSVRHPYFVTRLYVMVVMAQGDREQARRLTAQMLANPDLPDSDRAAARRLMADIEAGRNRL